MKKGLNIDMRKKPLDLMLYAWMHMLKRFDRRETDISYFDPEKVQAMLVVSSTAIGDTFLSYPGIRALRRRYPKARIVGHFSTRYLSLFENNSDIDEIIPYCGGYKGFFRTISAFRKQHFDVAVILHGNGPEAIPMAYLSRAPFVVRIPNRSEYRFLLSNKNQPMDESAYKGKHAINARLMATELVDCNSDNPRIEIHVGASEREYVDIFFRQQGVSDRDILIGFQVGSSAIRKNWQITKYAKLAVKLLPLNKKLRLVVTGSPIERKMCEQLVRAIKVCQEGVLNVAGLLDLKHLPALVQKFELLVTPDTGVMHIAIGVGTKTVSLFASTNCKETGPLQDPDKHHVIQRHKIHDPCLNKKCKTAECINLISEDEVFHTVKQLLLKGGIVLENCQASG